MDTQPGTRARILHHAPGLRDLAYATALLDAAKRMQRQADLSALLERVVAEAATIIPADGAAIVRYTGIRRTVVDTYLDAGADGAPLVHDIATVANDGWLFAPGCIDDLSANGRWLDGPGQVAVPSWKSMLVVALASPARSDQVRLFWFSSVPRSLAALHDVADLFAGHASLAIQHADRQRDRETRLVR